MKYLLVFFTITLVVAYQSSLPKQAKDLHEDMVGFYYQMGNSSTDFMKGFLKGINETDDIQKLYPCMPDLSDLFTKIKSAIDLIKDMKLNNMVKGFDILLPLLNTLFKAFKYCLNRFYKLRELIVAMSKFDSKAISLYILFHPEYYQTEIHNLVKALTSQEYYLVGKGVGNIFRDPFLS